MIGIKKLYLISGARIVIPTANTVGHSPLLKLKMHSQMCWLNRYQTHELRRMIAWSFRRNILSFHIYPLKAISKRKFTFYFQDWSWPVDGTWGRRSRSTRFKGMAFSVGCHAITRTSADIMSNGALRTKFCEIWCRMQLSLLEEMH